MSDGVEDQGAEEALGGPTENRHVSFGKPSPPCEPAPSHTVDAQGCEVDLRTVFVIHLRQHWTCAKGARRSEQVAGVQGDQVGVTRLHPSHRHAPVE